LKKTNAEEKLEKEMGYAEQIKNSLPKPYIPEEKITFARLESNPSILIGAPIDSDPNPTTSLYVDRSNLMPLKTIIF